MKTPVKITRALLSVSDKTGILDLARALHAAGAEILSTGGTAAALKAANIPVIDVSAYTGFPEIMDGRVKTLHPKIHGGILARRDVDTHRAAMKEHGIGPIDMVAVNLYPFAQTVAGGGSYDECVENIDIGGPAMIRAAAKNHDFVTVITDPADYAAIAVSLKDGIGWDTRQTLAAKAYAHTAQYDLMIAQWMKPAGEVLAINAARAQNLRYGENPHQGAALYTDGSARPGVATARQIQGKELSYNNLNDTDAAFELVAEFTQPAVAIIKHANPCGVAAGRDMAENYRRALACDPVSAFGGIIALNRALDRATAEEIAKLFCEVIIAPAIDEDARDLLAKKDKLRVLVTGAMPDPAARRPHIKTIAGGYLVQDSDTAQITEKDLKIVTKRAPTADEIRDMLFAFRVAKHVKSNAIVYAHGEATAGIGAGQMSRVDSSRIAAWKMRERSGAEKAPAPLTCASDAFFPFADGLISAAEAGVTAVIQPGGSIRDPEVIAAADARGLAMAFTGIRHFRH